MPLVNKHAKKRNQRARTSMSPHRPRPLEGVTEDVTGSMSWGFPRDGSLRQKKRKLNLLKNRKSGGRGCKIRCPHGAHAPRLSGELSEARHMPRALGGKRLTRGSCQQGHGREKDGIFSLAPTNRFSKKKNLNAESGESFLKIREDGKGRWSFFQRSSSR